MKKLLVLAFAFVFVAGGSAFSQDLEGKMKAGGYLGYSIGMGDIFDIIDASFNFGGTFHYGINEKMMIGGELGLQSYDYDFGFASSSETELNILGSILYAMSYEDSRGLMLTGGAGMYGGFDAFGINGGIVYSFPVAETIQLYGMPRFHIIFDDETPMMITLSAGAFFDFGDSY